MVNKILRFVGITAFIIGIAAIASITVYFRWLRNDYQDSLEQATQVAQEYLEKKYQTEMIYVEHQSIYDKMVWSIMFSEVDNPEQAHTVSLTESLDRTVKPVKKNFHIFKEKNRPDTK